MRVAIIGADGQLGFDLCRVIPKEEQVPLTLQDIDIADREKTFAVIKKVSPQIVINTAAYHHVDNCEDHEASAFAVNSIGVKYLAQACREVDSALVHISTDYVFDGQKNTSYLESDIPHPQSVYGISKLAGEFCVKYLMQKYFIVRSTGLYGVAGCMGKGGGNFVDNMLKRAAQLPELKVVGDEILSPTYTLDLATKINQLIRTRQYGLYHIVNHGECSWYEFTCKIFEILGKTIKIKMVTATEFKSKARRPKYSVLENGNLQKLGMDDIRPWPEALRAYLAEKGLIGSP